jgi:hypothetical protein
MTGPGCRPLAEMTDDEIGQEIRDRYDALDPNDEDNTGRLMALCFEQRERRLG